MTLLLRAHHLTKRDGTRFVIRDVSLMLHQSEVVCLLGATDSGKAELLRYLSLLDFIDHGNIEYGGYPVARAQDPNMEPLATVADDDQKTQVPANGHRNGHVNGHTNGHANGHADGHADGHPKRAANGRLAAAMTTTTTHPDRGLVMLPPPPPATRRRRRGQCHLFVDVNHYRRQFGCVFENHPLYPSRTVLENVIDGPVRVLGQRRKSAVPWGIELLRVLGVADVATRYPDELDTPQRLRVAIARALSMKPEVLLIDDLTADLDAEQTLSLMRLLRDLREIHNAAMLVATDHLAFAREVADRIYFLDGGQIVEKGSPRRISEPQTPRFKAFLKTVRAGR